MKEDRSCSLGNHSCFSGGCKAMMDALEGSSEEQEESAHVVVSKLEPQHKVLELVQHSKSLEPALECRKTLERHMTLERCKVLKRSSVRCKAPELPLVHHSMEQMQRLEPVLEHSKVLVLELGKPVPVQHSKALELALENSKKTLGPALASEHCKVLELEHNMTEQELEQHSVVQVLGNKNVLEPRKNCEASDRRTLALGSVMEQRKNCVASFHHSSASLGSKSCEHCERGAEKAIRSLVF